MPIVAQGSLDASLRALYRNGSGNATDGASVALEIRDVDGARVLGPWTEPAIDHLGLGSYEYLWDVPIAFGLGTYFAHWTGIVAGASVAGDEQLEVVAAGSITTAGLSYATIEDLKLSLQRADEDDPHILSQMEVALVDGTDRMTEELETDFFRHPSSGVEVRLVNGNGSALLHVHGGIVSLTQVRVRPDRLSGWVTLAATDYDLESRASGDGNQAVATVYPYDHVRLNGTGSYTRWPKGERLVEFTGAFGWPAFPRRVIEANVAMARQLLAADRTYPGGVISPDEAGLPIMPSRLPDAVYRLKAWASNLHASCGV